MSARVRLGRPSALHWATGARRPFAAAGSGTEEEKEGGGGIELLGCLSMQPACVHASTAKT